MLELGKKAQDDNDCSMFVSDRQSYGREFSGPSRGGKQQPFW